jgi:SAM-dependent methyltransferase
MIRADYGIDAPGVVRAMAAAGVVVTIAGFAAPWLPVPTAVAETVHGLRPAGVALLLAAAAMILSSKVGKLHLCRRLIALHDWRGDERVLDVGCGRGLSLIAAAKQLDKGGHATGVDLWSGKDLSDNAPDRTRANAAIEGVADRVTVDTGDACTLPYPPASFDIVTSMTAIHNIPKSADRARAFAEMARVLKPGGRLLLFDIAHPFAYAAQLRAAGFAEVRRAGIALLWVQPGVIWSARKPADG